MIWFNCKLQEKSNSVNHGKSREKPNSRDVIQSNSKLREVKAKTKFMVCDPIQQELKKKTRIKILRWDNSPVRAIVPSQNQTPLLGLNIDFRDNVTGQALVCKGRGQGSFCCADRLACRSRFSRVLLACVLAWGAFCGRTHAPFYDRVRGCAATPPPCSSLLRAHCALN